MNHDQKSRPRASIRSIKSWLFTPATRPDRFRKAGEVGADALIIDLEDSVAPPAKAAARATAIEYLEGLSGPHLPCSLRVNCLGSRTGLDDAQAFLNSSAQPDYLVLPKCESAGEIGLLLAWLREARKSAELLVQIETTKGMAALDEIARGPDQPAALVFGAADMAADLGADVAWEPLLWARSRLVLAAASGGIHVIDSPYFHIADTEGLRRETQAAAALGFRSKCAIHPAQIAIINEVLTPAAEEIARARKIVAVEAQGAGTVEQQMVDKAVVRAARLVLERAGEV
jgi:(S)-citramalyl-CoA lyase